MQSVKAEEFDWKSLISIKGASAITAFFNFKFRYKQQSDCDGCEK